MDRTLHLTVSAPMLDSAALVYRVVQAALAQPNQHLTSAVYYTGLGPLSYRRANVAGFLLGKLLIRQGYASTRLASIAVLTSQQPLSELEPPYGYGRVDFIVTPVRICPGTCPGSQFGYY